VKGKAGGANDFFSFDGCVPTENFQSLITEQWLTPRSHDACHIPSQFKDTTTMQDALDIQSGNIPQTLSRTNDTGSMMDLQYGDQLGGQVDSNFQRGVNPSHLGMGIDPVAPQNVLTPNEVVNQSAYPGYMGLATQSSDLAQSSGSQRPWNGGGMGIKDDFLARSQYKE